MNTSSATVAIFPPELEIATLRPALGRLPAKERRVHNDRMIKWVRALEAGFLPNEERSRCGVSRNDSWPR